MNYQKFTPQLEQFGAMFSILSPGLFQSKKIITLIAPGSFMDG